MFIKRHASRNVDCARDVADTIPCPAAANGPNIANVDAFCDIDGSVRMRNCGMRGN